MLPESMLAKKVRKRLLRVVQFTQEFAVYYSLSDTLTVLKPKA